MKQSIITAKKLCKSFGNNTVLDELDFIIYQGETVAFTGENGSGKSTILKMIGGLSKPSKGLLQLEADLKIGYIPEQYDKINFTIPEYIQYLGCIDGLSKLEIELLSKELYHSFYLEHMLNTPMKFLSKGTLQKVAVIQALLVTPDILLLDEPLSGQDYLSQRKFIELMLELKKKKVTIVMSCHEAFLIEHLADRVLHITDHKIVESPIVKQNKNLLYNILLFQRKKELNLHALDEICNNNGVYERTIIDDMIRIIIEKSRAQIFLLEMIKQGYPLLKFEEI